MGIDVSHWQGTALDWPAIKNSGIAFAYCKATEGVGYTDPTFTLNESGAKSAGLPIGAYHFARYDSNPGTNGADAEAKYFWSVAKNYIKNGGSYLMPMLDVEASFSGQTKTILSEWVNQWCLTVSNCASSNGVIIKPAIYCSSSHAATYFNSTITKWIPWIAEWPGSPDPQTDSPSSTTPWSTWTAWQYGGTTVPNHSGNVDGDVFNGTASSLLSTLVIGGSVDAATFVSSSTPGSVLTGATFNVSITFNNSGGTTWTNTGSNPYRLGSQNPTDNTTWGFNRVNLPSSPVTVGNNSTFNFTATAPASAGTYVFSWRMLRGTAGWFGDTFSTYVSVVLPGPGTNFGNYTLDSGEMDSTSRNGSYVAYSACGLNAWYSFGIPISGSNCTVFNRDIRWLPAQPQYGVSGRGYLTASAIVPNAHASATMNFQAVNTAGNDLAASLNGSINGCAYSCNWVNFFSGTFNIASLGGFRSNTQDDGPPVGSCTKSCGGFAAGYSQMHIQAARWQYIDDFTCLGGYSSSSVSDTANRSFNESSLYLYPAVDTSHGNAISAGLGYNGKTAGRVTTGDCNNANTLNFKGNAGTYGGGDNMDAYGFSWIFVPSSAAPKFMIGSSDGNRLWVNGSLKNDTNANRTLTRDQDVTSAVTLSAGWNRVLFKLHNFTNNFQGTVSLRNSIDTNLNEPSVNYYDLGGYYSYGLGYEQDSWYPQIVITNVYGTPNPLNAAAFYGNNTTVFAGGYSKAQGPVPRWRTMQYAWGYGLGNADTDYATVSGAPAASNWTHTATGVTGHRRLHFFAVSQSGRTSFQDSGLSGGSIYQDAGNYARYYDVFVDNVPPVDPEFDTVTATSTNQIALTWVIPPDQGVNVAAGPDEDAGAGGNQDSENWYRVGDVGVRLSRNGVALGGWGTATSQTDTNLTPNTPYTYTLEAHDNHTAARGAWNNSTGPTGTNIGWTLSLPPLAGSITPSPATPSVGATVTWTAAPGFGPGKVQYYRYSWDDSPLHLWTETELTWSSGPLPLVPTSAGTWYLHIKSYNGADVPNGSFDYSVTAVQNAPILVAPDYLANGQFQFSVNSPTGQNFIVQASTNMLNWVPLQTNTAPFTFTDTAAPGYLSRFYRVQSAP